MKKKNKNINKNTAPIMNNSSEKPYDVFDLVNKYGTYEVQATNGMENDFPKIAQGYTESHTDE